MKETTNYKLHKIDLDDSPPDITVLNDNWDKIDTKLKDAENHAGNGTVHVTSAEKTTWNNKADGDHIHTPAIAYGTCDTVAATAEKVITLSNEFKNWKLEVGSIIAVKFTVTNTASNPTFNVNKTGAYSIYYSSALLTTSSLSMAGYANRVSYYMYDGTNYVFMGQSVDSNTTYTNAALGHGYGTCPTVTATKEKVVTLSSYTLTTNSFVAVKFTNAVAAGATMNINSKGAKPIYYLGVAIVDGVINAGDVAYFVYNGNQYNLLGTDGIFATLKSMQGDLDSHTGDGTVHVTTSDKTNWNNKAAGTHNHDTTYAPISHSNNNDIHVTASDKTNWNGKAAGNHAHDYATSSHQHNASDINAGTLPVERGGTGRTSFGDKSILYANGNEISYTNGTGALYKTSSSSSPSIGTLPITHGGTGATNAENALNNLGALKSKDPVGTGSLSLNRKSNSDVGENSIAVGSNCTASAKNAFAEGSSTTASGVNSHAEGSYTTASGDCSHATGARTTASGNNAYAEGYYTIALQNQHALGCFNDDSLATQGPNEGAGEGTAFVIGNGSVPKPGQTVRSNAVRIDYNGKLWCKSAYSATGADYAELFEWQDGNPDNEDRRGYFVTMDGDMIRKAEPEDFILGIISANPCVVGNSDECYSGQFLRDEFNAYIYEETETTDPETGEVSTHTFYKLNPDYDPSLPYVHRDKRPEWDYVGMMGKLRVYDDGTCQVNGYCVPSHGGIATAAEHGYRVTQRITENIVEVIFSLYAQV